MNDCFHGFMALRVSAFATLVVLVVVLLLPAGTAAGEKKKKKKRKPPAPADAAKRRAMMHHQQGVMAHVQGDPDGAVAAFRRAVEAKPDFAYAYYRMGFVMEEVRKSGATAKQRKRSLTAYEPDAAPAAFRAAISLDPSDEMAHMALGHALHDRSRLDEAAAAFQGIFTSLNPKSAEAYWAFGRVRASGVTDEWDGDPSDPSDPSYWYEQATQLAPDEFRPDGTRVRRVEPDRRGERSNAENEARQDADARARRQKVLKELQDGSRTINMAGAEEGESMSTVTAAAAAAKAEL